MTPTAKSVFYNSFYMMGIVLFLRANPLLALIGAMWTALSLHKADGS